MPEQTKPVTQQVREKFSLPMKKFDPPKPPPAAIIDTIEIKPEDVLEIVAASEAPPPRVLSMTEMEQQAGRQALEKHQALMQMVDKARAEEEAKKPKNVVLDLDNTRVPKMADKGATVVSTY